MSTVAKKEKMSVRHMLVVLTGIMITFGCSALCFSTWGLFQPVVAEGLGVETTAFAMYVTVMYLTMTVASPFMGKLLQTVDIRIILSVSACLVGGAFLLMSVSNEIWMFYLAAVLLGLGEISILWLAIPTLINRWFADKAGTFIGLCMAFTGIGGAVWSAVFTGLRAGGMDFHTIYLIWAVIALVTSLPFTLFCVRSKPEDCGLAPYGASVVAGQAPAKPTGLSAAAAMKTPAFYSVCVFAGLINIAVLIAMQFPTYTKSLTDVAFDVLVVGGVMTTVMMVGQALFKLILGVVADRNAKGRFGVRVRLRRRRRAALLVRHCFRVHPVQRRIHLRRVLRHGRRAGAGHRAPVVRFARLLRDLLPREHRVQPDRRFRIDDLGLDRFQLRLQRRVHRRLGAAGPHPSARLLHVRERQEVQEPVDRIGSILC